MSESALFMPTKPAGSPKVYLGMLLVLVAFGFHLSILPRREVDMVYTDTEQNGNFPSLEQAKQTQNGSSPEGYVLYPKVFGHLHLAKTAGTEINGKLAANFERVCGHKGWSYDAYQFNRQRVNVNGVAAVKGESFNRGRVSMGTMQEIGFEDCDYISLENSWSWWPKIAKDVWPVELHVPCREPISHLMSMCNHQNKKFDCNGNVQQEIKKCLFLGKRFSASLSRTKNVTMKCFNPIPIDNYLDYMGRYLQRKRIEATYQHRDTNRPRNKTKECIWDKPELMEEVKGDMLKTIDYFQWCDKCMGSKDELYPTASR